MWQRVLVPICSKQLNRLKSDVFNRVARQLDEKADSEEGSAGEPVEPIVIPAGDLYEPIRELSFTKKIQSNFFNNLLMFYFCVFSFSV